MSADSRMAAKRNELLGDLADVAARLLTEHGVAQGDAVAVSSALIDHLASHWGGQMIYFPTDFQWRLAQLELVIWDAFRGDNFFELAKQHDMTESGVRRLISRVRAKLAAARPSGQLDLLEAPAAPVTSDADAARAAAQPLAEVPRD